MFLNLTLLLYGVHQCKAVYYTFHLLLVLLLFFFCIIHNRHEFTPGDLKLLLVLLYLTSFNFDLLYL